MSQSRTAESESSKGSVKDEKKAKSRRPASELCPFSPLHVSVKGFSLLFFFLLRCCEDNRSKWISGRYCVSATATKGLAVSGSSFPFSIHFLRLFGEGVWTDCSGADVDGRSELTFAKIGLSSRQRRSCLCSSL